MLTIRQVRDDLLSKLGVEDSTQATALMLQDVAISLNAALQSLQSAGQDYFTRETITGVFYAGSTTLTLDADVQAVIAPLRLTSGPNAGQRLSALQSRGEYDEYNRIFGGAVSFAIPTGDPVAYWIENLRNGNDGDVNKINILVVPVPEDNTSFEVDVINDAPNYTVAQLSSGTTFVPIAQNYAESLLLPLARLNITRSSQFSRPELLSQIQQDAQAAFQQLGMSGGFPAEAVPSAPRQTKG